MRQIGIFGGVSALLASCEPLASVSVVERKKRSLGEQVPVPTFDGPPQRKDYPSRQTWREACRQYERAYP